MTYTQLLGKRNAPWIIRLKTECKGGKLKAVISSGVSPSETGTWRGEEGHVRSCETLSPCHGQQDPVELY